MIEFPDYVAVALCDTRTVKVFVSVNMGVINLYRFISRVDR